MTHFFLIVPEFFLAISLTALMLFNARLIVKSHFVLSKEVFSQCFFSCAVLVSLVYLNTTTGFDFDFIFLYDRAGNILKLITVVILLLCFDIFYLSFLLQKVNFIELYYFFFFSLLSYFLLLQHS